MPGKPETARARAIRHFKTAHNLTYGIPSGSATWKIFLSKDPRKWSYQADFTRYPGGKYLCYTTITATIGWHWAENGEDFPDEEKPWAEAIGGRQILVLGATPIPPPPPADTALLLSCVESVGIYRGRFTTRTFLALGNHSLLCEHVLDPEMWPPASQLIEHIRQTSMDRLNGGSLSSKNVTWVFADESDKWP